MQLIRRQRHAESNHHRKRTPQRPRLDNRNRHQRRHRLRLQREALRRAEHVRNQARAHQQALAAPPGGDAGGPQLRQGMGAWLLAERQRRGGQRHLRSPHRQVQLTSHDRRLVSPGAATRRQAP